MVPNCLRDTNDDNRVVVSLSCAIVGDSGVKNGGGAWTGVADCEPEARGVACCVWGGLIDESFCVGDFANLKESCSLTLRLALRTLTSLARILQQELGYISKYCVRHEWWKAVS